MPAALSDGDVARACNHHLLNIPTIDLVQSDGSVDADSTPPKVLVRLPGRRVENDAILPRLEVDFQAVATSPTTMDATRARRRFIFGITIVTTLGVGQWQAQDYADMVAERFSAGTFLPLPQRTAAGELSKDSDGNVQYTDASDQSEGLWARTVSTGFAFSEDREWRHSMVVNLETWRLPN